MSNFCTGQLGWIFWLAIAFLLASLVLGAISAIKALSAKPPGPGPTRDAAVNAQQIGPILEALKGLIEALGKAPAWFALFLAGLFLFWRAGETYVDACKPPPPPPPCPQQCPPARPPAAASTAPTAPPGNSQ